MRQPQLRSSFYLCSRMSLSSAVSSSYAEPPDLDHIVHLVGAGKLKHCIALFQKLGFSVERGGGE